MTARVDNSGEPPDKVVRRGESAGEKAWRGKYRSLLWFFFCLVIFFIGVGQVSLNRDGASLEQPVFRLFLSALSGVSFSIGGKLENLVLPLLVLWGLSTIRDRGLRLPRNSFLPPLLVFLALATLSYFLSPFRAVSWSDGLRELLLGGGFFLAATAILSSERRQRIALTVLYIAVGISALAGFYLFSQQVYFPDTPRRIWLSFMHPNTTGSVLLLLIPLGIALTVGRIPRMARIIFGLATVLLGLAMVLTFSRTAWLGLLVGLGVLVMHWRLRFYLLGALLLLGGVLVLGVNFGPQNYLQNRVQSISTFARDPNIEKRLIYWQGVIGMIETRPLLGYGPGYRVFMQAYERDFKEVQTGEEPVHAHNMYLALGAGLGIPGLLAFLWLLMNSLGALRTGLSRSTDCFRCFYSRGMTAGLAGFLVGGLADNPLFSFRVMLVFWLLLAIVAAGERRRSGGFSGL